jgi:enoyl-CoA hydratase/carnithine racemase
MSAKPVILSKKDGICTVLLNRPEVMNAMNSALIQELYAAFDQIINDEETKLVILKGAGDNFCSGADINLFDEGLPSHEWLRGMKFVGRIVQLIREIPQPVIAELKGVAVGGGANLALAADFIVAADNARFCEIFINIGLTLDYGGTYFLPRLVGLPKARELAMLGNEIDGKTAASIGLIYKSVALEKLEEEVAGLANSLLSKPPAGLAIIKKGLESSFNLSLKEVLDWESAHQSVMLQTPEHKAIVEMFMAEKKKK